MSFWKKKKPQKEYLYSIQPIEIILHEAPKIGQDIWVIRHKNCIEKKRIKELIVSCKKEFSELLIVTDDNKYIEQRFLTQHIDRVIRDKTFRDEYIFFTEQEAKEALNDIILKDIDKLKNQIN